MGLPHFGHKQVYQSHFFLGGGKVGTFYAVEFFLGVLLSCTDLYTSPLPPRSLSPLNWRVRKTRPKYQVPSYDILIKHSQACAK